MPSQIKDAGYLDFLLPDFVRLSWTSDSAREVWASRFQRVIRAWSKIELLAGAFGVRNCALITVSGQALREAEEAWRSRGLDALQLEDAGGFAGPPESNSSGQAQPSSSPLRFVVGTSPHLQDFREAWKRQDTDAIGEFLGYPACCRGRFRERSASGLAVDHTWPIAVESAGPGSPSTLQVDADGPEIGNLLWRSVGIRAVPHLPCRFDCEPTLKFGQSFLDVALQLGFQEEVDWLVEILSWPVEWSALHGIAEIKTPILKISTRTEATARKLTVRWLGHNYPGEGAQGIKFPYKAPQRTGMTGSPAFQRGLVNARP